MGLNLCLNTIYYLGFVRHLICNSRGIDRNFLFKLRRCEIFELLTYLRVKLLPCHSKLWGLTHLTELLWQYHPKWKQPKWKFSTFCGLPRTTSYPYLPLRTIDPPDTRSHPQGGVQIYPQPNHLSKKGKKKYIPPNSDFS